MLEMKTAGQTMNTKDMVGAVQKTQMTQIVLKAKQYRAQVETKNIKVNLFI